MIEKIRLADFATNLILVLWVITLTVLMSNISNMTTDNIGDYENSFYQFCFLYYANSFSGLVISSVYFFRHQDLRNKTVREIKKLFGRQISD